MIPILDTTIALSGFGAGLLTGCLNNVWKTRSLFETPDDADTSDNVSFVVQHLEVNRDKVIFKKKYGKISNFIKPTIWNPLFPSEHLVPLTLIVISQVFIAIGSPNATAATIAILIIKYTFKIIVLPIVLNAVVITGAFFIRVRTDSYLRKIEEQTKISIEPSGHAAMQFGSGLYKLFVFSSLHSLNLSSNLYRAVAAVTTLSDFLWTHRTASSYHSVVDMALGTIFMGISFGTLKAANFGGRVFLSYGFRMLQHFYG